MPKVHVREKTQLPGTPKSSLHTPKNDSRKSHHPSQGDSSLSQGEGRPLTFPSNQVELLYLQIDL